MNFVVLFGVPDYRQCCGFLANRVCFPGHIDTMYLDFFVAFSAYNRLYDISNFNVKSLSRFVLYNKYLQAHGWSWLFASDIPFGVSLIGCAKQK